MKDCEKVSEARPGRVFTPFLHVPLTRAHSWGTAGNAGKCLAESKRENELDLVNTWHCVCHRDVVVIVTVLQFG